MAWPHLPGVLKVVLTFGFDGEPSVNVHFVLMDTPQSPITLANLEAYAGIFKDAVDAEWKATMGDGWTLDQVTATDWSIPNGQQFQQVAGLPITGTEATEEVPASVALVASHRTASTGRSFRGRTYMMGLTEGHVAGNDVDGGTQTAVGDYFDELDTELGLAAAALVVYSLYADNEQRVTPLATPVTSRIVNSRVDTQRRRLPG